MIPFVWLLEQLFTIKEDNQNFVPQDTTPTFFSKAKQLSPLWFSWKQDSHLMEAREGTDLLDRSVSEPRNFSCVYLFMWSICKADFSNTCWHLLCINVYIKLGYRSSDVLTLPYPAPIIRDSLQKWVVDYDSGSFTVGRNTFLIELLTFQFDVVYGKYILYMFCDECSIAAPVN